MPFCCGAVWWECSEHGRDGKSLSAGATGSTDWAKAQSEGFMFLRVGAWGAGGLTRTPMLFAVGEESLTIFVDKRKLSRKSETAGSASVIGGSGNSSAVSLETLHQLAASYFIDRESTLRRLHHIQIATGAIKVRAWEVLGEAGRDRQAETPGGGLGLRQLHVSQAWLRVVGKQLSDVGTALNQP